MILLSDFWMGRDKEYPADLTPDVARNAERTVQCVNLALSMFYADCPDAHHRKVRSGWRPPAVNSATPNAANRSKHMTAQACDLDDNDRELAKWSVRNKTKLLAAGINAMERPEATPTWVHWQTAPVGSEVFYFWPTTAAYEAWLKDGGKVIK